MTDTGYNYLNYNPSHSDAAIFYLWLQQRHGGATTVSFQLDNESTSDGNSENDKESSEVISFD